MGPKTIPITRRPKRARSRTCPAAARCSPASARTRSSRRSVRIFDTVNLTGAGLGNQGGGVDDLAGYAVQSIVLQVPERDVTRDGKSVAHAKDENAVVGVWASTERQSISVTGSGTGPFTQISRLGNPLPR